METSNCITFVQDLYSRWHRKHQKGDPDIGFVRKATSRGGRTSLVFDINYDYIPTEIEQIDRIIESTEEWILLCSDDPCYGDLDTLWKNSAFPILILKYILLLEGRQGIAMPDEVWSKYFIKVLLSGELGSIELLSEYDPHGLYGEITRLIYICWMPIYARGLFDKDIVKEFERLIYRTALQASNHIGKNGRTRDDEVQRTSGIAKRPKLKETPLEQLICIEWKLLASKGFAQRNIASMIEKKLDTTSKHARKTAKKYNLWKTSLK